MAQYQSLTLSFFAGKVSMFFYSRWRHGRLVLSILDIIVVVMSSSLFMVWPL